MATAYETDIRMLGTDSRSAFFLIEGDRFRVAYRQGGMHGDDAVHLWMPDRGWVEVATYTITGRPSDQDEPQNRRARAALKAHEMLRSV